MKRGHMLYRGGSYSSIRSTFPPRILTCVHLWNNLGCQCTFLAPKQTELSVKLNLWLFESLKLYDTASMLKGQMTWEMLLKNISRFPTTFFKSEFYLVQYDAINFVEAKTVAPVPLRVLRLQISSKQKRMLNGHSNLRVFQTFHPCLNSKPIFTVKLLG